MPRSRCPFPSTSRSKENILEEMKSTRNKDVNWQAGKAFSLVYFPGKELDEILKEAYCMYFSENGLSPTAFPSLRKLENEVVSMVADLLRGNDQVVGNITSGGTESILLAVLSAREWAKNNKHQAATPEIVMASTTHPAFEKAAHYFGLKPVIVPVHADFRADPKAIQQAINPATCLLVASAPSYPHGVIDPVTEIAAIAEGAGILCHVDACIGGFMLPFMQKLGYPIPDFDFSIPGVTSMSADIHKYGYGAKGCSVILYKSRNLRRHQFFTTTKWPGGIYASSTLSGTRPGGPIAAAWAIINHLGEEGYLEITQTVMETTNRIRQGILSIPGLKVISNPDMSILAIGSDTLNIYEIGDQLNQRGWQLDRQQSPPSLHMTISYSHTSVVDEFLLDLANSVNSVKKFHWDNLKDRAMVTVVSILSKLMPEKYFSKMMKHSSNIATSQKDKPNHRTAAMYGMMASLPDRGDINELVLDLLDQLTSL